MTATEFKNDILPAYGAMLTFAARLLNSRDTAADVVQDVIRGLWEKHESLSFTGSPTAFAMRCVKNKCIDLLRRTQKHSRLDETTPDIADSNDQDDEFAQRLVALDNSINQLEEPRKSTVRLSLAGHSTRQIAQQLNLSEDNVRQLLSRTRHQLRVLILKNSNL